MTETKSGPMSSEEIDKMTTEEPDSQAAEDALAATEESSMPVEEASEEETEEEIEEETEEIVEEESPQGPIDGAMAKMRRDAKASDERAHKLEIENAEMRGELKTRTAAPPEKSPIEIQAEAQGIDITDPDWKDEVEITWSLMEKQKKWETDQTSAKTAATRKVETAAETELRQTADELQQEYSPEKMGEGLDYKTVTLSAERLLTQHDINNIREARLNKGSDAALRELYDISLMRIRQNPATSKTQAKPKKKPTNSPKGEKDTGEPEVRTTRNARLARFVSGKR